MGVASSGLDARLDAELDAGFGESAGLRRDPDKSSVRDFAPRSAGSMQAEGAQALARLSVIIPVYNERHTLGQVLAAVSRALPGVRKDIIVVDDGSTDGTREWLKANFPVGTRTGSQISVDGTGRLDVSAPLNHALVSIEPLYHPRNLGKGAALRTGLAAMRGDVVVIQDADLEYDPQDWATMYDLIALRQVADVVYGSRFHGRAHRSLYFHHYLANRLISVLFNVLYNQTLSDIETCYKMMTAEVARSLRLSANDFGIEVEISAQIARQRRLRIYELGIAYYGRSYDEGKKINWKDGVKALWYLLKYRFA
jgi:glycosyltransferase involved in cell wall biosynthesis